jgi:hypothetical protein
MVAHVIPDTWEAGIRGLQTRPARQKLDLISKTSRVWWDTAVVLVTEEVVVEEHGLRLDWAKV